MKRLIVLLAAAGVSACATTDPGDGAGIAYRLPRTDAKVTLSLDVESCTPLHMEPSLTLEAVAGAREGVHRIDGRQLASAVARRPATVSIDNNGVITDINAGAADQESVVVGNVVKAAAAVLAPVLGFYTRAPRTERPPALSCSPEATRMSALATRLAAALDARRASLADAPDPSDVQKTVDALAAAFASARAALHASVSTTVALDGPLPPGGATAPTDVVFATYGDLAGLVTVPGGPKSAIEVALAQAMKAEVSVRDVSGAAPPSPQTTSLAPCRAWIDLPATRSVRVMLTPIGVGFKNHDQTTLDVAASQFDPPARLCVSTVFGENRSVALAFDPFGRTTKFGWSADARLANATGALAGAAPDAATLIKAVRGAGVARDIAETSHLAADNALRVARACHAALDAGAVACPGK